MFKPLTDVDIGFLAGNGSHAGNGSLAGNGDFQKDVWPEAFFSGQIQDAHVKTAAIVAGYLMRSGSDRCDAIARSQAIVIEAARRHESGSPKEIAMPIERLALMIAMEQLGRSIGDRVTVVPAERPRAMPPAAANRLARPLRAAQLALTQLALTWGAGSVAAPAKRLAGVIGCLPLRVRNRRTEI